ncbi:hypothetical protein E8E11_001562 [Didymella keratinophila]|nr:hypothetical protein E8E11_001562 [Didymella keratinophila]
MNSLDFGMRDTYVQQIGSVYWASYNLDQIKDALESGPGSDPKTDELITCWKTLQSGKDTSFGVNVDVKMAPKRPRQAKLHEDKKEVQALLEFPTEKSFDEWQDSRLVKPWWDTYVSQALDKFGENGKKLMDVENLIHRIHEGERLGKRKYKAAMKNPQFDNYEDYHAWLVLWLSEENTSDREDVAAKKSTATKKGSAKGKDPAPQSEGSEYDTADKGLDPEKGKALVIWQKGCPDEVEENGENRITIDRLCSHTTTSFWVAVEKGFDLSKHLHRRTDLVSKDGQSLNEVQRLAHTNTTEKKFIFISRLSLPP